MAGDEMAALRAERDGILSRVVLALCPACGPRHLMDDGRVWGLCGTQRLAGAFEETEIAVVIRQLAVASADGDAA